MKAHFAALALILSAALTACQRDVPRSQLPHLGTFCVNYDRWNDLSIAMKGFATTKGMEFHGGVEQGPDQKPQFNAFVARGYSYWFGDDLDLWFVSDPFDSSRVDLNGIAKRPWSPHDTELAKALITTIKPLQCGATHNGS